MSSWAYSPAIQLILLGDSGVGKSSLLLRFTECTFGAPMTLGVEIKRKTIETNNQKVRVTIWDTAGQEKFGFLTKNYFRKADGVVLVYDVTKRASFDNIRNWLEQIKNLCRETIKIILVGNKNENVIEREVMSSVGERFAKKFGLYFIETSSLNNENVDEMFHSITFAALSENVQQPMVSENQTDPPLHFKQKDNKSKCC